MRKSPTLKHLLDESNASTGDATIDTETQAQILNSSQSEECLMEWKHRVPKNCLTSYKVFFVLIRFSSIYVFYFSQICLNQTEN